MLDLTESAGIFLGYRGDDVVFEMNVADGTVWQVCRRKDERGNAGIFAPWTIKPKLLIEDFAGTPAHGIQHMADSVGQEEVEQR